MESFLPEADREYLAEKGYANSEITDGSQRGVIFSKWSLPAGKYSHGEADLLILIPNGYRDTALDMFYLSPSVSLLPDQKTPKAADQTIAFNGRTWQRWSRHLPAQKWRPGIDGLHTFLQAVQSALTKATP